MYLLYFYGAVRHGFEACNIHYEAHYKGWVLEIETFLSPDMAKSDESAIWAQKSRFLHFFKMSIPFPNCIPTLHGDTLLPSRLEILLLSGGSPNSPSPHSTVLGSS
jgi:hypothetical protein